MNSNSKFWLTAISIFYIRINNRYIFVLSDQKLKILHGKSPTEDKNRIPGLFFLFLIELTDHTARIADSQWIWWDIPGNYTASPNNRTSPNRNPWQDNHTSAQPTAITNFYWFCIGTPAINRLAIANAWKKTLRKFYRMGCRIKLYVRTDQHPIANGYCIAVHKGAIHINRYLIPNIDISSIITAKRHRDCTFSRPRQKRQLGKRGYWRNLCRNPRIRGWRRCKHLRLARRV